MLFPPTDTLKESAENAFDAFLCERDCAENEYNYITSELGFTNLCILSTIELFEQRARKIVQTIVDDGKPVGNKSAMFESLSFYKETTDAYDSETDYKKHVIPNVNDMLTLFEAFI